MFKLNRGILPANAKYIQIERANLYRLYNNNLSDTSTVEGTVYSNGNGGAIKIFFPNTPDAVLKNKLEKIIRFMNFYSKSIAFPRSIVLNNNYFVGYKMREVRPHPNYKDYKTMAEHSSQAKKLNYIIKASDVLKSAHKQGVFIIDIHEKNIMIDKHGDPVFIDTDNYSIDEFDIDAGKWKADILPRLYNKEFSKRDIDIFSFTLMTMCLLIPNLSNQIYFVNDPHFFERLISSLNVSDEIKNGLRKILGDSSNKPYLGDVLRSGVIGYPIINPFSVSSLTDNTSFEDFSQKL